MILAETVTGITCGDTVSVAVRSENIKVCKECKEGLSATVTDKSFKAGQLHMVLELQTGKEIVASWYGIDSDITVGQNVCVGWRPEHAVFVDLKEGQE